MARPEPPAESSAEPPAGSPIVFPCSQCGSDLRFQPGSNSMVCDYCGSTTTLPEGIDRSGVIRELDFQAAIAAFEEKADTEENRFVKCDSCGAEIELDEQVSATICPFCASPLVLSPDSRRKIRPAALIPFRLDERSARKAMTDWLGQLWFAPSGLLEYARKGRALSGIYVPYWTYDADTRSRYSGLRGRIRYETRRIRVNVGGKMQTRTQQVQRIDWRPVSGRVRRFFDDVLVMASTSLPRRHTEAIEPWDLSALEPWQPQYLAGFRAEGYTVTLDEGYAQARARMQQVIESDIRRDIGGDAQQILSMETSVSDITFKHVLLPIWMAAYKYRGKTYRFVVNGQTGRVSGERPWSAVKIALAVILGAVVLGVAAWIYGQNR